MSAASHSIITPECRQNRGDDGAWDEAVARAKEQYDAIVAGWAEAERQPTIHLVLDLERPRPVLCQREHYKAVECPTRDCSWNI